MHHCVGDALGAGYRLVSHLGSGAAGDVWLASSTADGPVFAAKILRAEHAQNPELIERFVRERSILVGLHHASIVAVRDLVIEGDTLAIIMDFVPGGTLRALLEQATPLAVSDALELCAQVFDALAYAAAKEIAHRDIKPDNILLTSDWRAGSTGTVRVGDFGIATVTSARTGSTTGLVGTAEYLSPELVSRGEITSEADVYATGIMLYELLSGRTPFRSDEVGNGTQFMIAYRHVTTKPPRIDVASGVWSFLEALLGKEPASRPTASEAAAWARRLAHELSGTSAQRPVGARAPSEADGRPATMHRGAPAPTHVAGGSHLTDAWTAAPEIGASTRATILRPQSPTIEPPTRRPERDETTAAPSRLTAWRRSAVLRRLGVGFLAITIIGMVLSGLPAIGMPPRDTARPTSLVTAVHHDPTLPTGLTISRSARFDPDTRRVHVTFGLSSNKTALGGDFLVALPAFSTEGSCPSARWKGVVAAAHRSASTGISIDCGWRLTGLVVPAAGSIEIEADVPVGDAANIGDQDALAAWVESSAELAQVALADRSAMSASYPVQRLQDISIVAPDRIVTQTALPLTLVPVWPSGADEIHPLYQSPAGGSPSHLLEMIAGGETGVRFSDACAGAISVSTDGLVVTTVAVVPECRVRASVGNFTDLESPPFGITTRG